jgi:ubiquinone/menaquinone biosynthesis C-methylase UbiE
MPRSLHVCTHTSLPLASALQEPRQQRARGNVHAATMAATQQIATNHPDLAAVKSRQQRTWSAGDYAIVGATLQIVGEQLCEAADLRPGQRVLDLATGNGGTAIAAARRFCVVTGADYVPELLERATDRARAERFAITFDEADAEELPYANGSFDTILSTFGVMFTADQQRAAAELLRVCRPGGVIALANWTPTGFIGQLFKTIGRHNPPSAGVASPLLWGTEGHVRQLFGAGVVHLRVTPRTFVFRYRSAEHFLDVFRTYYGPMLKAFEALDDDGREALAGDLHRLLCDQTTSTEHLIIPSEYLEIVATRSSST